MAAVSHRWIMHVDMDAFFAAIEQRDDPRLRGRPVVVGARPGGRGVVATCSYEARRFGIRSAMPISEAHRRCPDAIFLRPDMRRYAAESRAIVRVLDGISPTVEQVSIDEAFVDISGLQHLLGTPLQIAAFTKRRIVDAVGLTASVGIGSNRLIAKLASDYRKPDGVTVVGPDQVADFLAPMPVGNLRGIGARTRARLERLGLNTVDAVRRCPLPMLARHFGVQGAELLHRQSRGIGSDVVDPRGRRKSLSRETTFSVDVRDQRLLRETLRVLAADVGRRARAEALAGRVVALKIRFAGFETHTRRHTLDRPTNQDSLIFRAARGLAEADPFLGRAVRLIGVGLSDWGSESRQMDLFDEQTARDKAQRLYATLDDVQRRWGEQGLRFGMPRPRSRN
jgi:DNA polymerase-4